MLLDSTAIDKRETWCLSSTGSLICSSAVWSVRLWRRNKSFIWAHWSWILVIFSTLWPKIWQLKRRNLSFGPLTVSEGSLSSWWKHWEHLCLHHSRLAVEKSASVAPWLSPFSILFYLWPQPSYPHTNGSSLFVNPLETCPRHTRKYCLGLPYNSKPYQ